ncbi:hypothetical protein Ccrd_005942 [Cynara cardunculus var. scolymus]|uniref:Uncharacterized protein n=1 Tax=Cynara cardunculus var. scolymus TaxID=59895 RepID=A0A103XJV3_CYNCS|nr:hypothetical protein Ccrd_005942 [Cynara cardunculus var. scolymus]
MDSCPELSKDPRLVKVSNLFMPPRGVPISNVTWEEKKVWEVTIELMDVTLGSDGNQRRLEKWRRKISGCGLPSWRKKNMLSCDWRMTRRVMEIEQKE